MSWHIDVAWHSSNRYQYLPTRLRRFRLPNAKPEKMTMNSKLLIGVLLCFNLSQAFALDTQTIINPITGVGVWSLTQEDCGRDTSKGVIRENGKQIGCWWTNLTPQNRLAERVWFHVYSEIFSIPTSKLKPYSEQYTYKM